MCLCAQINDLLINQKTFELPSVTEEVSDASSNSMSGLAVKPKSKRGRKKATPSNVTPPTLTPPTSAPTVGTCVRKRK